MVRVPTGGGVLGKLAALAAGIAAVVVLVLVLAAAHILPQLRNPFGETTIDRSQPALLKSITQLSRYEAASGSFQVVVDLTQHAAFLPSFLEGSETLFIGEGTDIAFVDFGHLSGSAVRVSANRSAVTVTLPHAQLEPATLNVTQSYVFAQQQGLLNRVSSFFAGNPNSQQQVYELAQQKIQTAADHSPLLAEAQRNTQNMLSGLLRSLGFKQIDIAFARAGPIVSGQ
ncbi:MAG TPA: DUF4230 domain-containing protein [Streptosporangiaceae bacterium]|nr:DUF4230 domain-containing protein [Streptosporangiaceae bacterium]